MSMKKHDTGQVSQVRISLTDEAWNILYDSIWVQKAGLEEARSSRSRADTTGDGTYLPPAACLSRDRSLNNRVMNSH